MKAMLSTSAFWIWMTAGFMLANFAVGAEPDSPARIIFALIALPCSIIGLVLAFGEFRRARAELRRAKAELKAAEAERDRIKARIREALAKSVNFRRN